VGFFLGMEHLDGPVGPILGVHFSGQDQTAASFKSAGRFSRNEPW